MKVDTIVGHVGGPCKGDSAEQEAWENKPPTRAELKVIAAKLTDRSDNVLKSNTRHDRSS